MRRAWLISSGTELALGQTVDTNSAWLAQRLAGLGIRTVRHVTVGDDLGDIRDVLSQAAHAADVVVFSGGLGPTDDDLTRQALADVTGVELAEHAESLAQIRAFFAARGRVMHAANVIQAMLPRGSDAIPNARGTAPGIAITIAGVRCFALPGVPAEMMEMFDAHVAPRLAAGGQGRLLLSRTLHCIGLGEAVIGETIRDLMVRGRNPEVGTTAKFGIVGVRINAEAESRDAALALLDETERDVRTRLGQTVFGRDEETLAAVVGARLVAAAATVSTAESCTGGLLGELLTDVPGSSRYYPGGVVTYANDAKQQFLGVSADDLRDHGAVSAEVARTMAAGVRNKFGSTFGLAITGIAGPSGGSAAKPIGLVYLGLSTPDETTVEEQRYGPDSLRNAIRDRAAKAALNMLRLRLLGGPLQM